MLETSRPSSARARPAVMPLARALSVLASFAPNEVWLTNTEMAERCRLPRSTVSRMAQSLVALGYLLHSPETHKYRLAASVLALGYAAIANSDARQLARVKMKAFAEEHGVQMTLSTRERLDMIVVESFSGMQKSSFVSLPVGARVGIASSPLGWGLLAALPRQERYYLLENVERRIPDEWAQLRRRCSQAIAQVHESGFCSSLGGCPRELGIVAVPVMAPGDAPWVLACVGSSAEMTRVKVERMLGPCLVGLAAALAQTGGRQQ